jgi:hypothetical protein
MDMPFQLTAKTVGDLATFFGTGYVFRQGIYFIRKGRQPTELHTVALAVVTSLGLWTLFDLVKVPFPWFIPATAKVPLGLASRLIASFALGSLWGWLPAWGPIRRLRPFVGSRHGQTVVDFLSASSGQFVTIGLTNDQEILGFIDKYDIDPERFNDYHLTIKYPHEWVTKKGWVAKENTSQILVSARDIRAIAIMTWPVEEDTTKTED